MDLGAIVVAAGYGSFRNFGNMKFPKVLEDFGGRSILGRIVGTLYNSGITRIAIVVNPQFEESIRRDLRKSGFSELHYVVQPDRLGAADAAERALPIILGEKLDQVLITFGDMPLWSAETIRGLIQEHEKKRPPVGTMTTASRLTNHSRILDRYGRVISSGQIRKVVEPIDATPEELAFPLVNPCLWIWNILWLMRMIPYIQPKERGDGHPAEKYLPPLVQMAAQQGRWIHGYHLPEKRNYEALGVNTPEELAFINSLTPDV